MPRLTTTGPVRLAMSKASEWAVASMSRSSVSPAMTETSDARDIDRRRLAVAEGAQGRAVDGDRHRLGVAAQAEHDRAGIGPDVERQVGSALAG